MNAAAGELNLNHQATASVDILASGQNVFDALTDYSRYKNWLPGINNAQVLVREGDILVVVFNAPRFSPNPVTFEFVHNPPRQIIYQQVGRYRDRGLSGEWNIIGGSGEPDKVRLQGRAEIGAPFYQFSIKKRLHAALKEGLDAFRAQLGSSAGRERAATGRRVKLMEVRRLEDGLEVWYRGKVFTHPIGNGAMKHD